MLGVAVTVVRDGDQAALIDGGMRSSVPDVIGVLDRIPGKRPVSHILVTHAHPDHAWGLAELQAATNALVAAHQADVAILEGTQAWPSPFAFPVLRAIPVPREWSPQPVGIDIVLEHGSLVDVSGGVDVLHTPGHTPGSVCYFFRRTGLLYVGDALQYPNGRLAHPSRVFTRDMAGATQSIVRLAAMGPETIAFSHYPPITRQASATLKGFAASVA